MERKIEFLRPAWHKIHEDPKQNYGVGGVEIRMSLIGDKGAISWSILTGWHLPETYEYWKQRGIAPRADGIAMGGAVVIHSPTQMYEWDSKPADCDLLPGGKCYGDMGFIAGGEFFDALVREGEEAVWKKMKEWYADHFEEEAAP